MDWGPILFGAVVLYAALYYLVPNISGVLAGIESQSHGLIRGSKGDFSGVWASIVSSTQITLSTLFRAENFSNYKFWIFLYLAICVSSHMELSPPDIKGAKGGLISLVVFLLGLNLIILGLEALGVSSYFGGWWSYIKLENYSAFINRWLGLAGALFVFASIISGLNFIVSYILLSVYSLFKWRRLINPVW